MNYLLKVAICWLVFYVLYRLILEKTTFFRLNRAYLLITLLLGLVVPMVRISLGAPVDPSELTNWLPEVVVRANNLVNQPYTLPEITIQVPASAAWDIWTWLYWGGVAYCLLRFLVGLFQLYHIYRRGNKQAMGKYTLVYSAEVKAPFSFMRYLFWPAELEDENLEREYMLRHEETHILQYHTLDVLFSEIIKAICWFNPLAYHYSQALRDVHEYLADAAVLQNANRKQYGHLLIRQSLSGPSIALVNHFSTSQLKKRIHMMMRKKTQGRAQLRYALTLPLLVALGFLFAQINIEAQVPTTSQNSTLPPPPPMMAPGVVEKGKAEAPYSSMSKEVIIRKDTTPKVLEERVVQGFPLNTNQLQGQVINGYPSRTNSINELVVVGYTPIRDSIPGEVFKVVEKMPEYPGGSVELLRFLAQNILYPEVARKENIQGLVVVQFIIGKDGTIIDPHVVHGIGGGANEEALRVVKTMPKWKPGSQKGQAVNVQFNLPIRFMLDGGVIEKKAEAPKEVFKVVEQMPSYPGGQGDLLKFLGTNINYPKAAKDAGIEGMVVIQYIIEKDGSISNAKVVKGIGAGCDEEALRVVNAMPNWVAGKQRGQAVPVQFNLPIRFKLDDKKSNALPTNANLLKVQDFKASPNPSKGLFNLSFRAEGKATNIEVYNLAGQRVYQQSLTNFDGTYNGQLDLSKEPKGEYLLRITQGSEQYSQKVLKQ
ncbi:TonB family protein [Haliscomenobacter hydrossis]|uniref:TonB family protein n=1 Tax=Haliscomenobacter hydrossis (strain ATCC 27775 / DSM 1100 / LMG 10767 / O) TaxID=760192 RepID=F4KS10_HALH1|nr:TonB family protein [Haliscomenobacter hydrossis]AEE51097.1 TonB family protein [Haliscomenobacter hydrossis DSM 1100]